MNVQDMTLNHIGDLVNAVYPFIGIAPRSIMAWSDSTWEGPSKDKIGDHNQGRLEGSLFNSYTEV